MMIVWDGEALETLTIDARITNGELVQVVLSAPDYRYYGIGEIGDWQLQVDTTVRREIVSQYVEDLELNLHDHSYYYTGN